MSATRVPANSPEAVAERPPQQVDQQAPEKGPGTASEAGPARREHRYDIDLLRLVSAGAVIVGHVGGACMAVVGRSAANGPAVYWVGLFLDSVTKWAVPVYFAIAGWAVLMGSPPHNAGTLRKRSMRLIIPVGVWSAVYLAMGRWRDTNKDPISELALDAVFGTIRPAYHLWYFYVYVPLILLLGFIVLVRAGRRPWGVGTALLVIAAAPVALSDLSRLTGWDVPRFGWQFSAYALVYAVLGALLLTLPPTRHRRRWLVGAVAALAAVLWSQDRVHFVIPNASVFVAALSIAVLMSVNGLRIPERVRPVLTRLTGASLGAFMVHVLLLTTLAPWLMSADRGWLGASAAAAALTAATVIPSFALSLLWGRLRLRRFLG
jgi:surface polysaccharide O-acyltransferase-like enzyme